MLHYPTPAHYEVEPPLDVSLETILNNNTMLEAVEVPADQITNLGSVQRQVRLKWWSLPLNLRLNGAAVLAVTSAGETLWSYMLPDFACELFGVERPTFGVHVPAAKLFLQVTNA